MRFVSDHAKHRIVIQPIRKIMVEGQLVKTDGKSVQFDNGEYETDDKEIIEFLLNYDRCGQDYWPDLSQEKLWEMEAKKEKGEVKIDESETQTIQEKKPKFKIGKRGRKKA